MQVRAPAVGAVRRFAGAAAVVACAQHPARLRQCDQIDCAHRGAHRQKVAETVGRRGRIDRLVGGLVVSFRTGWQGDGFVSGFGLAG